MAAIIALFDNSINLEQAIEHLVSNDFDERVIDPSVATASEPALLTGRLDVDIPAPGVIPPQRTGASPQDTQPIPDRRILHSELDDLDIPEGEQEFYEQAFMHGAKFLLVETDSDRLSKAMAIVQAHNPSRAKSYD